MIAMLTNAVADPGGGARAPPSPHFWGPRLYSEAQIAPFYNSNNRKIFKKILPHFARHTISILNWHILIKNIKNYSFLRPQIIFWGPNCTFYTQITEQFSKKFASLCSASYFNSQLTYFDQNILKIIHFWGPKLYSEAQITPFYTQITENSSKNFASLCSAYYFNSQLTYFNQRH